MKIHHCVLIIVALALLADIASACGKEDKCKDKYGKTDNHGNYKYAKECPTPKPKPNFCATTDRQRCQGGNSIDMEFRRIFRPFLGGVLSWLLKAFKEFIHTVLS